MTKYTLKKEKDKLHVYVELVIYHKESKGPFSYEKISTTDVVGYLNENNTPFISILKHDSAHNKFGNGKGHWIFKIPLDKSSKQVILKEEKPVRPKLKRPRRTRSSTKKVSTEE